MHFFEDKITRRMWLSGAWLTGLFLCFWGAKAGSFPTDTTIRITEGTYEGADHFIIQTQGATYYYDKAGGGFSRILDPEGQDWIAFHREPWGEYPASAASAYRGLPNFVFGGDDSGAGHPGHEQCHSRQTGPNSIESWSVSKKWRWRWTFFADHARVEVLETAPGQAFWFLYEGTPGGRFDPGQQYFGTDTGGPRYEQIDYYAGAEIYENWQWAYFGHRKSPYALLIHQEKQDTLSDTFGYLGHTEAGLRSPDGMVVFGFGRAAGAQPLLQGAQSFSLGLVPVDPAARRLHRDMKRRIRRWQR